MADDVVFWKLRLTRTRVSAANSEHRDRDSLIGVAAVDCRPPPGPLTEFAQPAEAPTLLIERFVQDAEKELLAALGAMIGPQYASFDLVFGIVLAQLGFRTVQIAYGKDYRDLLDVEPCHRKKIYLHITYQVWEVKVAAAEAIVVGGVTYPKGDELATFRVSQPLARRFEEVHEWDPECCPERPPRVVDQHSDWDPPEAEWRSAADWDFDRGWKFPYRVRRSFE